MPSATPTVRRDTSAWRLQVWVSFGLSVMLCGSGLAWLPGQDLDSAFMVMGYVFCLSTAFALAKFIRDNQERQVDTPMWRLVVWSGFALAMGLTGWGLWRMEIQPVWKAYLGVCWLYLISNVFTRGPVYATAMGREGPWQGANQGAVRRPHSRAGKRCNAELPLAKGLPSGLWSKGPLAALQILAGYPTRLRFAPCQQTF